MILIKFLSKFVDLVFERFMMHSNCRSNRAPMCDVRTIYHHGKWFQTIRKLASDVTVHAHDHKAC